jgi:hypothetical protein
MKFFEPVNKKDKYRGYVRLDMRGNRGNMIVAAENLGDAKSTSEVYLYKDKHNKIKLGDINNKKGLIKKMLTFGSSNAIEDYNVCAVVKDGNLFSTSSPDIVRKLEADDVLEPERGILEDKKQGKNEQKIKTFKEKELVNVKGAKEVIELKEEIVPKEIIEPKEIIVPKEIIEPKEIMEAKGLREIRIKKEKEEEKKLEEKQETREEAKETEEPAVAQQRYRNRFDVKLYKTLKDYKEIEPLSVKLRNFSWWYIPYDEMGIKNGILPYYNQIISSYYPYPMSNRVTTCANLMKKYGHYIFGIYKENDEIVKFIYGIPGEFTKEEQPYKGVTGFKNWSYADKEAKEEYGYWLAFVNPKTGETTDPPKVSLA